MSDSDETPAGAKQRKARDAAAGLWAEYGYRHDMIWKLVFRVTAVSTALAIAPFLLDESAQNVLEGWLALLPALAVLVVVMGLLALRSEFEMLDRVKKIYQWSQDEIFHGLPDWAPHRCSKKSSLSFRSRVYGYLFLVLAGTVVFLFLFVFRWSEEI